MNSYIHESVFRAAPVRQATPILAGMGDRVIRAARAAQPAHDFASAMRQVEREVYDVD